MILNCTINSSIEINSLFDLTKLKVLMEELHFKVNKSKIARELGVDRRLIDKYMNGYMKPSKRKKQVFLMLITISLRTCLSNKTRRFLL